MQGEVARLLFLAAVSGDTARVSLLCCSAPDPSVVVNHRDSSSGKSCLWAAAEAGHLPAVRLLADSGASFNSTRHQPYGRTPLWAAKFLKRTPYTGLV